MLYKNLKELRKNMGISQLDLATTMKVSQQTIASWEVNRTEPSIQEILRIAEFFNVSTDYLLSNKNNFNYSNEALTPCGSKSSNLQSDILSDSELTHIKKYRRLDDNNRHAVDITIDSMLTVQSKEKTG